MLGATVILSLVVVFGYQGLAAEPQNQFAEFGLAKRIILPVMYCAFALMLVWPSRAERLAPRRPPVWWWLLLVALAGSSVLSLFDGPGLLAYLQGLALFGGAVVIAYAGLLSPQWTAVEKRNLFLVLGAASVLAIAGQTTGYAPFISILIPSAGAAIFFAFRMPRYRWRLALVASVLSAGSVLATVGKASAPISMAVLSEAGASLALLLILCVPFALRRYVAIGSLILVICVAIASDYLPMFSGASNYRDVTLAQRGYEARQVMDAVFASPLTALFGLGPGGVVDLSSSPDTVTLAGAGRDVTAVPSVHLLSAHMLLKLGLLGIVALVAIVVAVLRQVWCAASRRDAEIFDSALLFYVVAGMASAVPAATNLFANPLPMLFLAILSVRTSARLSGRVSGGAYVGVPDAPTAASPLLGRVRAGATLVAVIVAAAALTVVADRQLDLLPLARGAPPIPRELRPVAVFLGDSYTAGAGSTTPGAAFTTLIAEAEGWYEVNLGRGGTGYVHSAEGAGARAACARDYCPSYTEMIDEVAAFDPAYVVVSGGRSETWMGATREWAAGAEAFFVALRQALPDVKIIAISPLWDDEPPPQVLQTMRDVVRQSATAVGGTYLDLADPLLGRPDLVARDGAQPNDAGHAAIADAFVAAYHPD